ncbi:MAG: epoxyqueuosine reductase [Bacteriovoracaceae bacterium]|jgi:epoxyqueuosine reductase
MKPLKGLSPEFLKTLGVADWGYTEDPIPSSFEKYEDWVERGENGPLNYLSDHRKDLRKNLDSVQSGFQSALVFLFSYSEEKMALENFYQTAQSNKLKVAGYSLAFEGGDYHNVLREKMALIGSKLGVEYSFSLDIHPVLERDLAYRSGLGWFGKNSMLIHQKKGSFNMIGALLLKEKLGLDENEKQLDHCGQCTACFDICPTDAIDLEKREISASKCISTFSIELFKDADAPVGYENTEEIFGCDLCQDVCPWNKRRERNGEVEMPTEWPKGKAKEIVDFFLVPKPSELKENLEELSNRGFVRKFKGTSFERTGKQGLLKNLAKKSFLL